MHTLRLFDEHDTTALDAGAWAEERAVSDDGVGSEVPPGEGDILPFAPLGSVTAGEDIRIKVKPDAAEEVIRALLEDIFRVRDTMARLGLRDDAARYGETASRLEALYRSAMSLESTLDDTQLRQIITIIVKELLFLLDEGKPYQKAQ